MIGDISLQFKFPLNVYARGNTMWGYKSHHLKGIAVYSKIEIPVCKRPADEWHCTSSMDDGLNRAVGVKTKVDQM